MGNIIFKSILFLLVLGLLIFAVMEFINFLVIKPSIPQEITEINLTKSGNKAELYIENKNDKIQRFFTINFVSYTELGNETILEPKHDFINDLRAVFDAKTGEILPLKPEIPLKMKIYRISRDGDGRCCGKIFQIQKHNFYQKYDLIYDKVNYVKRGYLQTGVYANGKYYGVNRAEIDKVQLDKGFYKIEIETLKDLLEFADIKTFFGTSDSGLK